MRRALATRHITKRDGHYSLLHNTLRGRISCGPRQGLLLVVDGIPLGLDDLEIARMRVGSFGWRLWMLWGMI